VGLDIGSSSLKAVELRAAGKGSYTLASCGFEEISPEWIADGAIVDSVSIAGAIDRIFKNEHIQNDHVITSISGHSVIVKKISIHLHDENDLAESIRWEAAQNLPFDIDDVNFDFQVIGENVTTEMLDVLFVAVKKDRIQSYINVFSKAKKTPVILDVDAFALQNAYEHNYEPRDNNTAALLNIGASKMMLNLVSGTEFLFTRDISVGGQRYTEFLQKEFNINFDQAQALKLGEEINGISPSDVQYVIESVTEIISMEVQKTFDFFKSTSTVKTIDRMLVSGGAAHTHGLIDALCGNLDIPVEKFDSFRRIQVDSKRFPMIKEQAPDMAIAVGLALRSDEA
jgi:type IV pilus assembly protein PilM